MYDKKEVYIYIFYKSSSCFLLIFYPYDLTPSPSRKKENWICTYLNTLTLLSN